MGRPSNGERKGAFAPYRIRGCGPRLRRGRGQEGGNDRLRGAARLIVPCDHPLIFALTPRNASFPIFLVQGLKSLSNLFPAAAFNSWSSTFPSPLLSAALNHFSTNARYLPWWPPGRSNKVVAAALASSMSMVPSLLVSSICIASESAKAEVESIA